MVYGLGCHEFTPIVATQDGEQDGTFGLTKVEAYFPLPSVAQLGAIKQELTTERQ